MLILFLNNIKKIMSEQIQPRHRSRSQVQHPAGPIAPVPAPTTFRNAMQSPIRPSQKYLQRHSEPMASLTPVNPSKLKIDLQQWDGEIKSILYRLQNLNSSAGLSELDTTLRNTSIVFAKKILHLLSKDLYKQSYAVQFKIYTIVKQEINSFRRLGILFPSVVIVSQAKTTFAAPSLSALQPTSSAPSAPPQLVVQNNQYSSTPLTQASKSQTIPQVVQATPKSITGIKDYSNDNSQISQILNSGSSGLSGFQFTSASAGPTNAMLFPGGTPLPYFENQNPHQFKEEPPSPPPLAESDNGGNHLLSAATETLDFRPLDNSPHSFSQTHQ